MFSTETIYNKYLTVEVADTPSKHQQGLQYRDKLGENDGMMFKFHYPKKLKFWGLNTYLPLSIAFISPDNTISKIDYISPYNTNNIVSSDDDCNVAIEANYDFFTKNHITVGQKVDVLKDGEETLIRFKG